MDEILYGADSIAAFLWPTERPKRRKCRVYHLARTDRLPVFKIGGSLCASPARLHAWIAEREAGRGKAA
jgi:hypothetical protein